MACCTARAVLPQPPCAQQMCLLRGGTCKQRVSPRAARHPPAAGCQARPIRPRPPASWGPRSGEPRPHLTALLSGGPPLLLPLPLLHAPPAPRRPPQLHPSAAAGLRRRGPSRGRGLGCGLSPATAAPTQVACACPVACMRMPSDAGPPSRQRTLARCSGERRLHVRRRAQRHVVQDKPLAPVHLAQPAEPARQRRG